MSLNRFCAYVMAIQVHLAMRWIEEPLDQMNGARFTGPGAANECDILAGSNEEGDIVQGWNLWSRVVVKADASEFEFASDARRARYARCVKSAVCS